MKTIVVAASVFALSIGAALAQSDAAQSGKVGDIEVAHAWAVATTGTTLTNSAAYMSLTDRGTKSDRLVAAASPVAQKVELHVFDVESGVFGMHRVDGIEITPGAAPTVLGPGGAHVMLDSLKRPLRAGTTIPLTLTFQRAGSLTIEVPVESLQGAVASATEWMAPKATQGLFLKAGKGAASQLPAR